MKRQKKGEAASKGVLHLNLDLNPLARIIPYFSRFVNFGYVEGSNGDERNI